MDNSKTPHLALDYLMPEQAQKHVTINEALRRLDGLVHISIKNKTTSVPPENAAHGDRYLIGKNAEAAWQMHDGKLALYEDGGWAFIAPQAGWMVWDESTEAVSIFNGHAWQAINRSAPPLFTSEQAVFEPARSSGELKIPSHITLLGVTAQVLEAITGPQSWQLGVENGLNRFGSDLPLAENSAIRGPADPPQVYWHEEAITLTPKRGAFQSGRIAIAIHYIRLPLPDITPPSS